MAHEPFCLVPLNVILGGTALLVSDDAAVVMIPGTDTLQIDSVDASISVRAFTSGTATLNVKNNAGTTLLTKAITAAGFSTVTPSVSTIAGGDRLRFGFTGLGVGLADVLVTLWLKMTSRA